MKKECGKSILSLGIFVLLLASVSAQAVLENESIVRTYTGGEPLAGTFTLSLSREPATNFFQTSFPGKMSLIDFLRAHRFTQDAEYNCSTRGCLIPYTGREVISSLVLTNSGERVVGFEIKDPDVEIRSIDFSVSSTLGQSCGRPLSIVALEKNTSFVSPTVAASSGELCGVATSGCFDASLDASSYKRATLSSEVYCNQISLEPAPAIYASAVIDASSNTSK